MKKFWLIVEIAAYAAFFVLAALIWVSASMPGDGRFSYETPGSLGILLCVIVGGIARARRGAPGA